MNEEPAMTIIGVTNPGEGDDWERNKFTSNMRVQIPHVLDDSRDIWQQYGVVSQPSMVFVNADGTWERHLGRHDPLELLERAQALLAANA